jgi:gas vesicle protein
VNYFLLISLVSLLVLIIPYFINKELCPTIDAWAGFLGNYIGALLGGGIGALVAYFVARKEIDEMRAQEHMRLQLAQKPAVAKIKYILNKIIGSYQEGINFAISCESAGQDIKDCSFKTTRNVTIIEGDWNAIDLLLDTELQLLLLSVKDNYQDFIEVSSGLPELNKLKKENEKIETKRSSYTHITVDELSLQLKFHVLSDKTDKVFSNLNNMIQNVALAQQKINALNERIDKL